MADPFHRFADVSQVPVHGQRDGSSYPTGPDSTTRPAVEPDPTALDEALEGPTDPKEDERD